MGTSRKAALDAAPVSAPEVVSTTPVAERTYVVTIRIQTGLIGGDQTVTWNAMPESRVRDLLEDKVDFIRLPASYSTHPGGESKFINRDQIMEVHTYPAWPFPEPW